MVDIQNIETYMIDDEYSLPNIDNIPLMLLHTSRKYFPIYIWQLKPNKYFLLIIKFFIIICQDVSSCMRTMEYQESGIYHWET